MNREHCKYCEHELCPTCNECHNLEDNFYFTKPLKKCFDLLYLVCKECGRKDETVATIFCGYDEEIHNTKKEETICQSCEKQHLGDI